MPQEDFQQLDPLDGPALDDIRGSDAAEQAEAEPSQPIAKVAVPPCLGSCLL